VVYPNPSILVLLDSRTTHFAIVIHYEMGKSQSKISSKQLSDLRKHCLFDKKELQQRYKIFVKDCPSGSLDRDGFSQIYQQVFSFGDPGDFADFVFNVFDGDGNGKVDFREFICGLSITSRGSLEEKLEWTFQLYDIDGNGVITYSELLQIVQSVYKMTGSMVELSPDEDTPEHWVDKIFNSMDRDKDHKITYEELVEGSRQDPAIIQALTIHNSLM